MKRIGLLTSGGDAPGMNAAIRSCIKTAVAAGAEIYGIHRGYAGLLAEEITPLSIRDAGGIVHHGGTVLKTARCLDFHKPEKQKEAAGILRKHGIEGLIVIGGDGSMAGAAALEKEGIPTAVIPGTIDNDMCGTDETIGFDTAVNTVREAAGRIRDTAASHDRAALIEVMGRHAGNIALAAGLAAGAEFILIPEIPFDREKLACALTDMTRTGRTNSIIICAEGAADARELGKWLGEATGIDMCTTILGYIQRGGAPSARDAILGALLGAAAAEKLLEGQSGFLAGMKHGALSIISYEDAFAEEKIFDRKGYDLAVRIGAGMDVGKEALGTRN